MLPSRTDRRNLIALGPCGKLSDRCCIPLLCGWSFRSFHRADCEANGLSELNDGNGRCGNEKEGKNSGLLFFGGGDGGCM